MEQTVNKIKIRSRKHTYLTPDRKYTRDTIHPQLFIGGQWVYINDKNTVSGLVECETHQEAREIANTVVTEIDGWIANGKEEHQQ